MEYSILCVDDEDIILESLKAELESALGDKCLIELAQNHIDALQIIEELTELKMPIPVVISDFQMPGMKGDELLIKIHQILPDTKKIMLTGQSTIEGVTAAVNHANLYKFVAKPWSARDFAIIVKDALNSYFENDVLKKQESIEAQKKEIEARNRQITDSIDYAKKIQLAMMPSENDLRIAFGDAFLLYLPKEGVSGDFFWLLENQSRATFALGDCTGHGVPGAVLSMLGQNALTTIVEHAGTTAPGTILLEVNAYIQHALRKHSPQNRDGVDMAVCTFDWQKRKGYYAGAMIPLFFIQDGVPQEFKPDQFPLGASTNVDKFTEYTFELGENWRGKETILYFCSDGYQEQFGSTLKSKFSLRRLRTLLADIHKLPMALQRVKLNETILNWIKDAGEKQADDITIIGVKIVS